MKLVFPLLGITSQLTLCFYYKHVRWVHVNTALNGQYFLIVTCLGKLREWCLYSRYTMLNSSYVQLL